jgi:hypothetical protein
MFAVIYRAFIKPGLELEYQEAWRQVASHFAKSRGAIGSCLHKTEPSRRAERFGFTFEGIFRQSYVFAILTMCRTLYSLQRGSIASKTEAAQWVIKNIDTDWKDLIEKAISWKPYHVFNRLEETQRFVKYVLNKNRYN